MASVLGRVFRAPMLPGVYPELGAFEQVKEHLRTLAASDLAGNWRRAEEVDSDAFTLADSLRAYRDYDDRWALAFLLEDIGILAALRGDARSGLELIGAADASRDAIGASRAPSLEEEIREQIAPAAAALSAHDRLTCRERGRSLDLAAAIDHALAVCERTATDSATGSIP